MISSFSRHAVHGNGSQDWIYREEEVLRANWYIVSENTCKVELAVRGKVLDSCEMELHSPSNSHGFNLAHRGYFAMGYVTLSQNPSGEINLEFNVHYGKKPTSNIGVL